MRKCRICNEELREDRFYNGNKDCKVCLKIRRTPGVETKDDLIMQQATIITDLKYERRSLNYKNEALKQQMGVKSNLIKEFKELKVKYKNLSTKYNNLYKMNNKEG